MYASDSPSPPSRPTQWLPLWRRGVMSGVAALLPRHILPALPCRMTGTMSTHGAAVQGSAVTSPLQDIGICVSAVRHIGIYVRYMVKEQSDEG